MRTAACHREWVWTGGPDKRWKIFMTHWKKKKIENLEGHLIGGDTGNQTKHVQEKNSKQNNKEMRNEPGAKPARLLTCVSLKAQSTCELQLTDSLMIGT